MNVHHCELSIPLRKGLRFLQAVSNMYGKLTPDLPAEPSVGLIREMLGPLSTTSPSDRDGRPSSNVSFQMMYLERLTLKILGHIVKHQVHQLIETLEGTGH